MKSRFILLMSSAVLIFALFAFTLDNDPPATHKLDEKFQWEWVANTSSKVLRTNLAGVYSDVFDHITQVDIHQDELGSFYYVAYGWKKGIATIDLINITDDYARDEYYPSRADMGIAADAVVIPCHCKGKKCKHYGAGIKCGVATDTMIACAPGICPERKKPIGTDN